MQKTTGVLLVNLGTPDAPEPKAVGRYLRQFLMDPLVIDIPWIARYILVHLLVVPRRKIVSASQYKKVWTEKGSPLLFHTKEATEKLAKLLPEIHVEFGMRYGNPSIESAVAKMKAAKVNVLTVLPLYPQYSVAATESSVVEMRRVMLKLGYEPELRILPPFYDSEPFLDACAELGRPYVEKKNWDKILFSYHGLPERQIKKIPGCHNHCFKSSECCNVIEDANRQCYRAQCVATTKGIAKRLGFSENDYEISFQSRLGGTPWIKPYTDQFYETLPKQGIKRLLVFCPSFVADCLETVEEVSIRGLKQFQENGGETITLVPSLNSEEVWVSALRQMVTDYQPNT